MRAWPAGAVQASARASRQSRTRRLIVETMIAGAFVGSGVVVASMTVPTVQSPQEVARAYLLADYQRDYSRMAEFGCDKVDEYLEEVNEYLGELVDYDAEQRPEPYLAVGDLELTDYTGDPRLVVPYKFTDRRPGQKAPEREELGAAGAELGLQVVQEEGKFRVCGSIPLR